MTGLLLALDTAGARCSAAVYDMRRAELLSAREPEIGRGHAERLMGVIAEVLSEADIAYADLERIGVVVGPGSFTGQRVGVAAARGLALALSIPAVGVSTLAALAEPYRAATVLAVMDAKRGQVYAGLYAPGGHAIAGPCALAPEALADFVSPLAADAALTVVGSGAVIAQSMLQARLLQIVQSDGYPGIASVARLAADETPKLAPKPLYLRGADAKPPASPGIARSATQAPI